MDAGIIVHKIQGRTMLTDENGFYNRLLKELFRASEGNALIVLLMDQESSQSKVETEKLQDYVTFFYKDLYDSSFLETLINQGKQPALEVLMKTYSVVTLQENPNSYQEEFFLNFLYKSLYKPIVDERLESFGVQKA